MSVITNQYKAGTVSYLNVLIAQDNPAEQRADRDPDPRPANVLRCAVNSGARRRLERVQPTIEPVKPSGVNE